MKRPWEDDTPFGEFTVLDGRSPAPDLQLIRNRDMQAPMPPDTPRWRPSAGSGDRLTPLRMARQEQLAAEIMELISTLDRTMATYATVQSGRPMDASARQINTVALEWMSETLGDLSATVVGVEAAFLTNDTRSGEARQA